MIAHTGFLIFARAIVKSAPATPQAIEASNEVNVENNIEGDAVIADNDEDEVVEL